MTRGESVAGVGDGLAPVIPLFGATVERLEHTEPAAPVAPEPAADWRSTWDQEVVRPPARADGPEAGEREGPSLELAEKHLLRKLRTKSLSVSEARAALVAFGLEFAEADGLIDAFVARGYLDDAALAEQVVHIGVDRKGQGRRAIAQALAKRGVPREVADEALRALPDDDADRALEFARSKARALAALDRDTALRRLTGQLARRGYGGSAAFEAARRALDEVQRPGPSFA